MRSISISLALLALVPHGTDALLKLRPGWRSSSPASGGAGLGSSSSSRGSSSDSKKQALLDKKQRDAEAEMSNQSNEEDDDDESGLPSYSESVSGARLDIPIAPRANIGADGLADPQVEAITIERSPSGPQSVP